MGGKVIASKRVNVNGGYWRGRVDATMKGIKEDVSSICGNIEKIANSNSQEHKEIHQAIESLKVRAARWGGMAGVVVSVGGFLALLLLKVVLGIKF